MQFGKNTKQFFFSVTYTTDVGQMRCVPQVCYKLTEEVRTAVVKMAEEGLAKIYREEVRFISGVALPIKKPDAVSVPVEASSSAPQEDVDTLPEEDVEEDEEDKEFD